MRANWSVKNADSFSSVIEEIIVGNYHYLNLIQMFSWTKGATKETFGDAIGKWKIKNLKK